MELNDRKKKILQTIIEEYIGTAEPVGSRVISKKNELGLSSATIRNEMADLEEMGYLMQPHTSAGRIPSDIGYRFYVDSLMRKYRISMEAIAKMQQELEQRVNQLDILIKKASMITAALTDYTTIISTPQLNQSKIKKIDLISLGNYSIMLIVVAKTGVVRNQVINAEIEDEMLEQLGVILNKRLCNLTVDEITFDKITSLEKEIQETINLHPKVLINILNFVYETIELLDKTDIYVDNMQSILNYPEYNDIDKAREMLNFLDDRRNMRLMLSGKDDEKHIHVKIGKENQLEQLHDCSLVTVHYSLGDKVLGKIGVIGPKRMNYAKVVSSLDCISENINRILYQLYIGENEESE